MAFYMLKTKGKEKGENDRDRRTIKLQALRHHSG
jgi:hypothetical protein